MKSDGLIELLSDTADIVAPRLLGCEIEHVLDDQLLRGRVVETEAYDQTDAASHSYRGRTPRTDVMFGPPGRLYVYFTYGMYYCCNVVTGPEGHGSAVLLRAIEPLSGEDAMLANRQAASKAEINGVQITNGPAKLCQALRLDKQANGHDLRQPPIRLVVKPPLKPADIVSTSRIGISQATDAPWRFYLKNNPYVSKL